MPKYQKRKKKEIIRNYYPLCGKCKKAMTPKVQVSADGKKVRVCRKCNEPII